MLVLVLVLVLVLAHLLSILPRTNAMPLTIAEVLDRLKRVERKKQNEIVALRNKKK